MCVDAYICMYSPGGTFLIIPGSCLISSPAGCLDNIELLKAWSIGDGMRQAALCASFIRSDRSISKHIPPYLFLHHFPRTAFCHSHCFWEQTEYSSSITITKSSALVLSVEYKQQKTRPFEALVFITAGWTQCFNPAKNKNRLLEGFATFTFMHLADAKRLTVHSGYTCFITMCVPWESNPQPFALLTQCSTTEPQEPLSHRNTSYENSISECILNVQKVQFYYALRTFLLGYVNVRGTFHFTILRMLRMLH